MSDPVSQGDLFIGLMSGTSMDGIDAAVVRFSDRDCELRATLSRDYPGDLQHALRAAVEDPDDCNVDTVGQLDRWVGECFRDAVLQLLADNDLAAASIAAVGSHGQTLRHRPHAERPFTLQVGDPNIVAAGTGITTVADFRRRDMAIGGGGAPLAPAFHQWLIGAGDVDRVVLNIGGIANITTLASDGTPPIGFDTGPGNTLLDGWIRQHRGIEYDHGGAWAASGRLSAGLLESLLQDDYFSLAPPKTSGLEYFNLRWLEARLAAFGELRAADVQATLSALTANSIATAIASHAPTTDQVLVCGGGAHNTHLMELLGAALPDAEIASTETVGLHPDWVEAVAFAWLAMRCLEHQPGNLPSVTGASRETILGGIYLSSG